MFRYIDMPKLVAFYLREFSLRNDGETSNLYKFVFCLCLPFISETFRRARLIALAIAECTNSQDQIFRLLEKITGATVEVTSLNTYVYVSYDDSGPLEVPYDADDSTDVPYEPSNNYVILNVSLNGASADEVLGYLQLLIPFYVYTQINFVQ